MPSRFAPLACVFVQFGDVAEVLAQLPSASGPADRGLWRESTLLSEVPQPLKSTGAPREVHSEEHDPPPAGVRPERLLVPLSRTAPW